jgi:signal transduction histidine kinase
MERQAATRLQELDDLKNTLLDVVAHDLRSPLAAIRALTSVLRHDALTPVLSTTQRDESLAGIQASADKMRALLDDLLDLEQFASGETTLRRSPADLAAVVRAVVAEHTAELTGRRVRLHLDPVTAVVDPVKLQRIIENLVVNAVRHTPAGTAVAISLRRDGETALICVDDSGAGVPADLREVIFARLRQAPGADRTGLGMGLSLVQRLARLHGGRAWVEEAPSGGASFRVRLPVTTPTPADPPPADPPRADPPRANRPPEEEGRG